MYKNEKWRNESKSIRSRKLRKFQNTVYNTKNNVFMKDNNTLSNGVIDLFIVYNDHIDLIDYKLKNIDDPNYIKQVTGYKEYLTSIFNKPVNGYLYSIMDTALKEV